MKRYIAVLSAMILALPLGALEKKPVEKIDLDQLIEETLLDVSRSKDHIAFVWYIPNASGCALMARNRTLVPLAHHGFEKGRRAPPFRGASPICASHFRDAIYLNQAEAETLFRVCSANFNLTLFQFFSTNLRENSAGSSALINRK